MTVISKYHLELALFWSKDIFSTIQRLSSCWFVFSSSWFFKVSRSSSSLMWASSLRKFASSLSLVRISLSRRLSSCKSRFWASLKMVFENWRTLKINKQLRAKCFSYLHKTSILGIIIVVIDLKSSVLHVFFIRWFGAWFNTLIMFKLIDDQFTNFRRFLVPISSH